MANDNNENTDNTVDGVNPLQEIRPRPPDDDNENAGSTVDETTPQDQIQIQLWGDDVATTNVSSLSNDESEGGGGDETLDETEDDDVMTGGTGTDTFVFAADHGHDTISEFTDGEDLIDLSAFTDISGLSELTVTQDGADTVISVPGGGTITLQDFTSTDLDASDFVFHEEQQDSM